MFATGNHHTDQPVCHFTTWITAQQYLPEERLSPLPLSFVVFFATLTLENVEGGGSPKPGVLLPKNSCGICLRGRWVSFPQEGGCGMSSVLEEGDLCVERLAAVVVVLLKRCQTTSLAGRCICDVNTWELVKTQIPRWDIGYAELNLRRIVAALGWGSCFVALVSPKTMSPCYLFQLFWSSSQKNYSRNAWYIRRRVELVYFEDILNEVNLSISSLNV